MLTAVLLLSIAAVREPSAACLTCHTAQSVDSHSIGVVYDSVQPLSRTHLRRSSSLSGLGSTVAADLLVDGKVECTSCHEGHDVEAEQRYRLRNGLTQTKLCLACHEPV
jgi:predicted CXXCH cytochrome family protein